MDRYEEKILRELHAWRREVLRSPGLVEKAAKRVQDKLNGMVPAKLQQAVTSAVKGTLEATLWGMDYIPSGAPKAGLNLAQRDAAARELLERYRRIAALEGAGTGAGGLLLGLADFPALIAIKMKFLFELAHVYGFDTRDRQERLFLLHVFQLAFSSGEVRRHTFETIERWDRTGPAVVNWERFQREYRDSIDLRKLLQLVPGIGAAVGAWANYHLLDDLGRTGMNAFRWRLLAGRAPEEVPDSGAIGSR